MSGKRQNGVDLDQALERPPTAQAGSKRVVAEEDVPKADVDMIDLTMSSDDEAPAPAPKRQATAQICPARLPSGLKQEQDAATAAPQGAPAAGPAAAATATGAEPTGGSTLRAANSATAPNARKAKKARPAVAVLSAPPTQSGTAAAASAAGVPPPASLAETAAVAAAELPHSQTAAGHLAGPPTLPPAGPRPGGPAPVVAAPAAPAAAAAAAAAGGAAESGALPTPATVGEDPASPRPSRSAAAAGGTAAPVAEVAAAAAPAAAPDLAAGQAGQLQGPTASAAMPSSALVQVALGLASRAGAAAGSAGAAAGAAAAFHKNIGAAADCARSLGAGLAALPASSALAGAPSSALAAPGTRDPRLQRKQQAQSGAMSDTTKQKKPSIAMSALRIILQGQPALDAARSGSLPGASTTAMGAPEPATSQAGGSAAGAGAAEQGPSRMQLADAVIHEAAGGAPNGSVGGDCAARAPQWPETAPAVQSTEVGRQDASAADGPAAAAAESASAAAAVAFAALVKGMEPGSSSARPAAGTPAPHGVSQEEHRQAVSTATALMEKQQKKQETLQQDRTSLQAALAAAQEEIAALKRVQQASQADAGVQQAAAQDEQETVAVARTDAEAQAALEAAQEGASAPRRVHQSTQDDAQVRAAAAEQRVQDLERELTEAQAQRAAEGRQQAEAEAEAAAALDEAQAEVDKAQAQERRAVKELAGLREKCILYEEIIRRMEETCKHGVAELKEVSNALQEREAQLAAAQQQTRTTEERRSSGGPAATWGAAASSRGGTTTTTGPGGKTTDPVELRKKLDEERERNRYLKATQRKREAELADPRQSGGKGWDAGRDSHQGVGTRGSGGSSCPSAQERRLRDKLDASEKEAVRLRKQLQAALEQAARSAEAQPARAQAEALAGNPLLRLPLLEHAAVTALYEEYLLNGSRVPPEVRSLALVHTSIRERLPQGQPLRHLLQRLGVPPDRWRDATWLPDLEQRDSQATAGQGGMGPFRMALLCEHAAVRALIGGPRPPGEPQQQEQQQEQQQQQETG